MVPANRDHIRVGSRLDLVLRVLAIALVQVSKPPPINPPSGRSGGQRRAPVLTPVILI
jgi:hypothetical protein